jgi:hypothetical protein
VLKIFLALLPALLAFMHRKAGRVSLSQIDFGVVSKFYIFQFFAVFVFTFIGGAVLNQVRLLLQTRPAPRLPPCLASVRPCAPTDPHPPLPTTTTTTFCLFCRSTPSWTSSTSLRRTPSAS